LNFLWNALRRSISQVYEIFKGVNFEDILDNVLDIY